MTHVVEFVAQGIKASGDWVGASAVEIALILNVTLAFSFGFFLGAVA